MAQATQTFFSIEKLRTLLNEFDNSEFPGKIGIGARTLRGFVFTGGTDLQTNEPAVFAFPLYTLEGKSTSEDAVLVQNLSASTSGCPYPPACK